MILLQLLLALVALSVLSAALARRMRMPTAVALVLGGMAVALTPGRAPPHLEPELTLALFLPPLLQISAYRTDWPAFRLNLRPILLLAVGAVLFTTAVLAVIAKLVEPQIPWAAAIALGAIASPPDAVAATAVLRKLSAPSQVVTVVEGESLINDASALLLVRLAVGLGAAGSLSFSQGALLSLAAGAGGALIGYVVGQLAMLVFRWVEDTLLDIVVSLLTGFAGYFAAEAVGASGVLAAVACGYVLGTRQHAEFSARTRLDLMAVWSVVEFLLASLLFILIGLQLRAIGADLAPDRRLALILDGLALSAAVIAARFLWVFGCAVLSGSMSRSRTAEAHPWKDATIISWAGMRGVVSLAAALALPAAFPARDLIIVATFVIILVTLLLQGTTLGALVARLAPAPPPTALAEAATVRADVAAAARDVIEEKLADPQVAAAAGELIGEYKERAEEAARIGESPEEEADLLADRLRLRLEGIDAARHRLIGRAAELEASILQLLTQELDLEESQIRHLLGATTTIAE